MKELIPKFASIASACLLFLSASFSVAHAQDRVTPEQLKTMLKNEKVVLIDVRTPEEHAEMHIPGSILMPLNTLQTVEKLPTGGKIVIYCRSGKRSLTAMDILAKKGFKGLVDLEGGILAWKASGGEVVSK